MDEIDKTYLFTVVGACLFLNLTRFHSKNDKEKCDKPALHYDGAVLKIGTCQ